MNKLTLVIIISISYFVSSCEIDDEKEKIDRLAEFAMHDSVIERSEQYLLRCKEEEKANLHYQRSVAFKELLISAEKHSVKSGSTVK